VRSYVMYGFIISSQDTWTLSPHVPEYCMRTYKI
jgi:hypothetical protein